MLNDKGFCDYLLERADRRITKCGCQDCVDISTKDREAVAKRQCIDRDQYEDLCYRLEMYQDFMNGYRG